MHWTNWFGRMLNVSLAAICWCTRTMKSIVSIIDEFRKRLRSFFPSRPEAVAVQSATSYRRRDEFSSLVAKCDHECWTCPKAAKAFTIKKKTKCSTTRIHYIVMSDATPNDRWPSPVCQRFYSWKSTIMDRTHMRKLLRLLFLSGSLHDSHKIELCGRMWSCGYNKTISSGPAGQLASWPFIIYLRVRTNNVHRTWLGLVRIWPSGWRLLRSANSSDCLYRQHIYSIIRFLA